jgi:pantoate--beta-alanine ligase
METLHSVASLRERVRGLRSAGRSVAFVPTMGNLHAGHLNLVRAARARAGAVVASIFVNPLQFGPNEDLDAYPRTLEADREALAAHGTDLLFAPSVEAMYPDGAELQTRVSVRGLADILCGASRPGHFDGVATVVTKLLNLVQPDIAVFGRKDYQQLIVIRQLVRDLSMQVRIVGIATERAADGLALSSRNGYLTTDERGRAPELKSTLRRTAEALRSGERDFPGLEQAARASLEAAGMRPDYIAIRRSTDLAEPTPEDTALVVLGAAFLGRTRLIDNLVVHEDLA